MANYRAFYETIIFSTPEVYLKINKVNKKVKKIFLTLIRNNVFENSKMSAL